jgi:hypothetical protein
VKKILRGGVSDLAGIEIDEIIGLGFTKQSQGGHKAVIKRV